MCDQHNCPACAVLRAHAVLRILCAAGHAESEKAIHCCMAIEEGMAVMANLKKQARVQGHELVHHIGSSLEKLGAVPVKGYKPD